MSLYPSPAAILPPLFNQFFPGVGSLFDGLNADPHGITNFRGVAAMGYANGLATDNSNNAYQVITDTRVYQGLWLVDVSALIDARFDEQSSQAKCKGTLHTVRTRAQTPPSGS